MDPGADHSRQEDASRMEAAQARGSEQPQAASDAGWRDRKAVVREAFADQREREADQREREADQREALANRREREADQRDEQMQALIGELRSLVTGAQRDALAAIEGSLELLSVSADSFQRGEEAVQRAAARRRREEAAIARAAAQAERQRADSPPAGQGFIRQARELRTRLSATVAAFAAAEDNAAGIFDQLAASHPERAGEYQRRAQQARDAADRARELSCKLAE